MDYAIIHEVAAELAAIEQDVAALLRPPLPSWEPPPFSAHARTDLCRGAVRARDKPPARAPRTVDTAVRAAPANSEGSEDRTHRGRHKARCTSQGRCRQAGARPAADGRRTTTPGTAWIGN